MGLNGHLSEEGKIRDRDARADTRREGCVADRDSRPSSAQARSKQVLTRIFGLRGSRESTENP